MKKINVIIIFLYFIVCTGCTHQAPSDYVPIEEYTNKLDSTENEEKVLAKYKEATGCVDEVYKLFDIGRDYPIFIIGREKYYIYGIDNSGEVFEIDSLQRFTIPVEYCLIEDKPIIIKRMFYKDGSIDEFCYEINEDLSMTEKYQVCYYYLRNSDAEIITDDVGNKKLEKKLYLHGFKQEWDPLNYKEYITIDDSITYLNNLLGDEIDPNSLNEICNRAVFIDQKDSLYDTYLVDGILYADKDNELYLIGETEDNEQHVVVNYKEKSCIINHYFINNYGELPDVYLKDADNDGENEIIVSFRKYSGNIRAFSFYVCDDENGLFEAIPLDDLENRVNEKIKYDYDEDDDSITFSIGSKEKVTVSMPDYIKEYPFTGKILYTEWYSFDVGNMTMTVTPHICLENSLPYTPIDIVFNIEYKEGEISIFPDRFEYIQQ